MYKRFEKGHKYSCITIKILNKKEITYHKIVMGSRRKERVGMGQVVKVIIIR